MQFYNSMGPNPQVVRMFMAERDIEIPTVEVDLQGGENRREPYKQINPAGQMPALELDDGSVITEVTVICEFLDETTHGHSLFGDTAKERAQVRRWTRWCDLNIVEPMINGFRYAEGLPLFEPRIRVIPEAADGLKAVAQDNIAFLDKQLEGKEYIVGNQFSFADLFAYCFLAFGSMIGQTPNPECKNIAAFMERIGARESAKA